MGTIRNRKDKWAVYGEFGGYFTNLKDAKLCAKEYSLSKPEEHITIDLLSDGCNYITYKNGRCIRDGWSIKK